MHINRIWVIAGPTGAGKSALAVELALRHNAEIVSADACQIYRGLPVLTAQPTEAEQAAVPHHLIGTRNSAEELSATDFAQLGQKAIRSIHNRGKIALVVGGSGFYLRALFGGGSTAPAPTAGLREQLKALTPTQLLEQLVRVDPLAVAQIDRKNPRRVQRALEIVLTTGQPFGTFAPQTTEMPDGIVMHLGDNELGERIKARAHSMLANGAIEEVAKIQDASASCQQVIGWRDIQCLLAGEIDRHECEQRLAKATWQYARRQMTWFRNQTPWTFADPQEAMRQTEDWFLNVAG